MGVYLLWALVFWAIAGFFAYILNDNRNRTPLNQILLALTLGFLAGGGAVFPILFLPQNPVIAGLTGVILGTLTGYVAFPFLEKLYTPPLSPAEVEALQAKVLSLESTQSAHQSDKFILDQSALCFGDLVKLINAAYFTAEFVVPRFTISRMQADLGSEDPLRQALSSFGLNTLERLQKESTLPVSTFDAEVEGHTENEQYLTLIAQLGAKLITADETLHRQSQQKSLPTVYLPELRTYTTPNNFVGEKITVSIVEEGQEQGQGVGYLENGTKILVDGGAQFLGRPIEARIRRIYDTVAGEMIWATID